ncbi:MAG: beta-propeller repeat protein [Variovorax sp.]|nr:beta-propeller repeat protein [Variovorax sp.]
MQLPSLPFPRTSTILRGLCALCVAAFASATVGAWAAGPKAYVGNFKDSTVSVVDIDQGQVSATLPVAAGPDGMVVTPGGASVFVSGSSASSISVIDTATDRVSRTVEVGSGPQGLAVVPGGKTVLAAVNGADLVAFIDVASASVAATVPVPKPHTIAVRPDGTQAYVASQEPGKFSVVIVDLAARKVVGTIALDKPPRDLEFGPDGKTLYLTLAGLAAVQVIDSAANRIVGQIPTGVSPHVAQVFAGQARGVAVVQGPGEVEFFDPATNTVDRKIAVGKQPHWLDITPEGRRLVVSNEGDNTVSIVDIASGQMRTVAVGNAPRKIAVQHVSAADHAAKGAARVSIANFAFMPAEIAVAAGQSVNWRNDDGAPHGVQFKDGATGAPLMLPKADFSRKFDKPGSYDYVCSVHPYMTGRVVVEAP